MTEELEVNRVYDVTYKDVTGKWKMSAMYLGRGGPGGDQLQFSLRPTFGTVALHTQEVLDATPSKDGKVFPPRRLPKKPRP